MLVHELIARHQRRWRQAITVACFMLLFAALVALSVGEIWITPFLPDGELESQLLTQLRLPRVLGAIIVGASLAVSGAVLQVLLGNPLAEPGVLGISGGASLAVVFALFGLPFIPSPMLLMVAAMAGAMIFTFILVSLAKRTTSTARILLVGVALGILSGAVVTWAFYFSSDLNLRQLLYWLMGSLSGIYWSQVLFGAAIIPAIIWLCYQGKHLDMLMMGELQAQQLGLDTNRLRWQLILLVSFLVGVSVAIAGVVGFVGLVVPHFLRLWFGSENRFLLPLSAISGALLLLLADTIGRLAIPSAELPVGVVTTSIGAPLFIWILLRRL